MIYKGHVIDISYICESGYHIVTVGYIIVYSIYYVNNVVGSNTYIRYLLYNVHVAKI
jgi:hypothetical protein